jgi:integrase/recombinase XerD
VSKKKASLSVAVDLSDIFDGRDKPIPERSISEFTINKALEAVVKQMEATGLRERTISDYEMHVKHYVEITGVQAITDVSAASVYEWLGSMQVSNQTKLTRLKCLKAFLERCTENGWLTERFWRSIKIKVDTPVKELF